MQFTPHLLHILFVGNTSGFPLVGGGLGESSPLPKKLACPPCPPLFWPKNADFVIFMQLLAILPKLPKLFLGGYIAIFVLAE